MRYGFGIDVGGTTVKLGLFTEPGELLEKWEIPTRTEDHGGAILPDIVDAAEVCLVRRGLSKEQVLGLGIGVPGPVRRNGVVAGAPIWDGEPSGWRRRCRRGWVFR